MSIYGVSTSQESAIRATIFLQSFARTREGLKQASDALLAFVETLDKEDRPRYLRTHKQMVRLARDWNRIEHERELDASPP